MKFFVRQMTFHVVDGTATVWEVRYDPATQECEAFILSPYKPSGLKPDPVEQRGRAIGEQVGKMAHALIQAQMLREVPK